MKKYFSYLLIALLSASFIACSNNNEPNDPRKTQPEFTTVAAENSDGLVLEFSSPDPGCGVPKIFHIWADYEANELTLTCTNMDAILVQKNVNVKGDNYSSSRGQWKVSIVDSNKLKIVFDGIKHEDFDETNDAMDGFAVISATNDDMCSTYFEVHRWPDLEPVKLWH